MGDQQIMFSINGITVEFCGPFPDSIKNMSAKLDSFESEDDMIAWLDDNWSEWRRHVAKIQFAFT